MKLVGLKTQEMGLEGRSSSILFDTFPHSPSNAAGGDRTDALSPMGGKKSYGFQVAEAVREMKQKQQQQLQHLVDVLRCIEAHVNLHHHSIIDSLDRHRFSLSALFKKAAAALILLHSEQSLNVSSPLTDALKIIKATLVQVDLVLGTVEEDVGKLIGELAADMCEPMVAHVRELREATLSRQLVGVVDKIIRAVREWEVELEVARKRVKMEEDGKVEALRRLRECEEKLKGMNDLVQFYPQAKFCLKRPLPLPNSKSNNLVGAGDEEHGNSDEKLLGDILEMKKRKIGLREASSGKSSKKGGTDQTCFAQNSKSKVWARNKNGHHMIILNKSKHDPDHHQSVINCPRIVTRLQSHKLSQVASCSHLYPVLGASPSAVASQEPVPRS